MDFEIVRTEPAFVDLEAVVRQRAEEDPGRRTPPRIAGIGRDPARFPWIGPAYGRDRTGRAREILCRQYRIFYRVDEPQRRVEILTVWHGSRREPRLPG